MAFHIMLLFCSGLLEKIVLIHIKSMQLWNRHHILILFTGNRGLNQPTTVRKFSASDNKFAEGFTVKKVSGQSAYDVCRCSWTPLWFFVSTGHKPCEASLLVRSHNCDVTWLVRSHNLLDHQCMVTMLQYNNNLHQLMNNCYITYCGLYL